MKLFYFILTVLAYAVILTWHGYNNNSLRRVSDIKSDMDKIIMAAKNTSIGQHTGELALIHEAAADSILQLGKAVTFFENNALKPWQQGGTLTAVVADNAKTQLDALFLPLENSAKDTRANQWLALAFIFLIGVLLLWLAMFTSLLNDDLSNPSAGNLSVAPYSLARTQVAFWIGIIASVYLYSVFWRNCPNDIQLNTTALALMGISAGTFVAGALMDNMEIGKGMQRHQDLVTWKHSFLGDLLSDNNGISIHRFQNVVWTVVAILIYFYRYNRGNGCLPELDGTLLTLTGISSATYLTLKSQENTVPPAAGSSIFQIKLIPGSAIAAGAADIVKVSGFANAKVVFINAASGVQVLATADPADKTNRYFIVEKLAPGTYDVIVSCALPVAGADSLNIQGVQHGLVVGPTGAGYQEIAVQ